MQYRNEKDNDITMFATDDITQKVIAVNIHPPEECADALSAIFTDEQDYKRVSEFFEKKLGSSRVRPFSLKTKKDNIAIINKLIGEEMTTLQSMFI